MANHTAAERERIAKRRRKQRLILEGICVAALALFLIFCVRRNARIAALEKAALSAPTEDPALTDERLMYLRGFADSGYTIGEDAVRLALCDSAGSPAQLIAYMKSGNLCVKYVFSPNVLASSGESGSELFPNIDVTESPYIDHSAEAAEAASYFIPLAGSEYAAVITNGISAALEKADAGKDVEQTFIAGIYRFDISFTSADKLMMISAEPS